MSSSSGLHKSYDNECSGPRPPVPGEESRVKKMTEGVPDSLRNSPPSYLNWARNFNNLLEDRDGVELFKKYVEEEAPAFNDHLNFYFACEGLKQQTDPDKIQQIIGAIYRFLRKSQLSMSDDLRRKLKAGLKNEIPLTSNVFDPMQQHVETSIRENIYPTFLCSEMYILYIQEMSALHERSSNLQYSSQSSSSSSSGGVSCTSSNGNPTIPPILQTTTGVGVGVGAAAAAATSKVATASTMKYGNVSAIPMSLINLPTNTSNTAGPSCSTAAGAGSASGSVYGPSTSASSSGSISATDTLPRSSTLPTLHEDSELSLCDDFEKLRVDGGKAADMPMRLTHDLLLATQTRRLEIRPPGAHGYVYPSNTNTSYVPNSRVDSERASVSSGGRTDSDTMSLSSCSMDGRPYIQRKHSTEDKVIRQKAMANRETNSCQVIPRTQRIHSNQYRPLKENELMALLIPKLEEVKLQQDLEERARAELKEFGDDASMPTNERLARDRAFAEAIREKFHLDEDNDQDILDQHVSRVWKDQTPHRSPGTMSPCPPIPSRRRTTTQDSGMFSDGTSLGGHSMKHSKSMPDHSSSSRKLTSKWPSMNTDSGISLFSSDTLMKYKDTSMRTGPSTASNLEGTKRRLEDETRRSRRYTQQHPLPMQPPQHHLQPITFSSSSSGSSSLHHQAPPPPLPAKPQETTTVVFTFCDEEYPYRTKIPGTHLTLRQFKDSLPKKGNFRFFFKTHCEDLDSPVIQEEVVNDSDILPLFEGKVMGLVKPSE